MWKLTIYQKKQFSTWKSEQEVSVLNADITVLSDLMEQMANCNVESELRFEISKAEQEEPQPTFEELVEESRFINSDELEEVPAEELADANELF